MTNLSLINNDQTMSSVEIAELTGKEHKNVLADIRKMLVEIQSAEKPADYKDEGAFHADSGSAARFFYCAKASRKERNEGLQDPGPQFQHGATLRKVENTDTKGNNHPTVKPTDLMAYLCRLVTPPGGIVLDPFMGSGSTGKAAMRERFQFIGIEMDQEYFRIAELRIKSAKNHQQNPTESKEAQLTLFSEGAA